MEAEGRHVFLLIFLLIAVYSVSNLALRENMEEFDQALSNINVRYKTINFYYYPCL